MILALSILALASAIGFVLFGHFGYLSPEPKPYVLATVVDDDEFDDDGD